MAKNVKRKKKTKTINSFKKKIGFLILKIALVIIAFLVVYGIYLDQQIKERIDGEVWQLPMAVYGQIIDLEPGDNYQKEEVATILKGVQYRQVLVATRPGEFVVNANNIEVYRRPFDFPDSKEPEFQARILFDKYSITRIENTQNGLDFGILRIDPKLITMMHSPDNKQRLFVPLQNFPDSLIKILVATEDKRFYEHDGVSATSILRAIYVNLITGKKVQGGSTITQQLVKNLFLTNERTYLRKFKEACMAIILDSRYSKERILELYLNEVYLGQDGDLQIHGFPLASLYYFGRPVNELSLDQQALLVGLLKGASYYNPWTKKELALDRRNVVLGLMEQDQIIDKGLFNLLSHRPLGILPKGGVITPQPTFMQLVRQSLKEQLGDQADYMSGMKVFTTLDPLAQNAAELAMVNEISTLEIASQQKDLQSALIITDRQTGEIRALIGSKDPQYYGFNRVLYGRRPIGSLAKPATYLTALSQPEHYQLNSMLDDKPISIKLDGKNTWQPNNFDKKFRDKVMLVDALAQSINIPAINVGMSVGLDATEKSLISLGVPKSEIKPVPSRFLGTLELTPIETAQMFQAITNNGKKSDLNVLRFVMSDKGELIYQNYPKSKLVVSAQAAYLTTYAMQQTVKNGTARVLKTKHSDLNLAAKTGSTNDLRDSWFVGVDGKNVAVVWVGLDDHKPMRLTGSTGALKIYERYLDYFQALPLYLQEPANIDYVNVNTKGEWVCNNSTSRILPAWTIDKKLLCTGFNEVPRTDEPKNEAPSWLTEIFGL